MSDSAQCLVSLRSKWHLRVFFYYHHVCKCLCTGSCWIQRSVSGGDEHQEGLLQTFTGRAKLPIVRPLPSSRVPVIFTQPHQPKPTNQPTNLCPDKTAMQTVWEVGQSGVCSYLIWPCHASILQCALKRSIVGGIRGQTTRLDAHWQQTDLAFVLYSRFIIRTEHAGKVSKPVPQIPACTQL